VSSKALHLGFPFQTPARFCNSETGLSFTKSYEPNSKST